MIQKEALFLYFINTKVDSHHQTKRLLS